MQARPTEARGLAAMLLLFLLGAVSSGAGSADDGPAEEAYRAGSEALRSRNYEDAVAALERALELRPEHTDSWLKLGISRSALLDWDGAIEAYGRLLEIDPEHAKAHHNLGNVYFRRGDLENAVLEYGKALELEPDYMLAAFHRGWMLRELGRADEAERSFRLCLELPAADPRATRTRVDCVFGLGSIRHRAGDYEASAQMMEQVLRVHRDHLEARYYLGMAYRQLGRTDEAEQQLEIHRQMLRSRREQPSSSGGPAGR